MRADNKNGVSQLMFITKKGLSQAHVYNKNVVSQTHVYNKKWNKSSLCFIPDCNQSFRLVVSNLDLMSCHAG